MERRVAAQERRLHGSGLEGVRSALHVVGDRKKRYRYRYKISDVAEV